MKGVERSPLKKKERMREKEREKRKERKGKNRMDTSSGGTIVKAERAVRKEEVS